MTQSPPKALPSSRPPAAPGGGAGGRLTTALAAGGSVLVLSTIAVVLWPRTYGTEASFAIEGVGPSLNAMALAGRIEAALLERQELAGVAMELPPELRSPDPIGRLRAGIRVQSHGPLGYGVEFRGSDQQSVQRIANRLADRAVALVPQLASPQDNAPAQALALRTRAVTEFLTAHPEMTLEAADLKPSGAADSGLEALRTEKRQIEQRLTTGAHDNPYSDPGQTPEILNRRLTELKLTIARREKALKEPHPTAAPAVAPELVAQWRALLAELGAAQAAASVPSVVPVVRAHVTARAPLPSSPLTPNRMVLSIVAALLSAAAAMAAYALPRFSEPPKHKDPRPKPQGGGTDPLVAIRPASEPPVKRSEPPPAQRPPSEPPVPLALAQGSEPPALVQGSEPPPAQRSSGASPATGSEPPANRSDPPAPIAAQRTVVLSGPTTKSTNPAPQKIRQRSRTAPGGIEAPVLESTAPPASPGAHSPPAAPLFGSRPPPGAGSYSVSSSHPPAMDAKSSTARTSVERLSPLQSAHPPASQPAPMTRRGTSPPPEAAPQIVSLPPALDPQAETWAARFETPPPPPPEAAPAPPDPAPAPAAAATETPPKRAGRWKTQAMGSMAVPLEVLQARERGPDSVVPSSVSASTSAIEVRRSTTVAAATIEPRRQAPNPNASTIIHHDMAFGWRPNIQAPPADVNALRDGVLKEAANQRLTVLVTGSATSARAHIASALAFAIAESGARTLLVEADFDTPALHRALAFTAPPGAGFSQQLMARRQARQPEPWVVMRCSANLQVIVEGRFRSPGLLASREFEHAIQELREQYHVVIIHAVPLAKSEDLRPLAPLVNGVVVVQAGQPSQLRFGYDPLRPLL